MDTVILRPPQPPRRRLVAWVLAVVLVLVVAAGAAGWWWFDRSTLPVAVQGPAPAIVAPVPAVSSTPEPGPRTEPEPTPPAQPFAEAEAVLALDALLGRDAVLSMLQTSQLPQRIVATVDNLGRESAPASMWPVNPTRDRFLVVEAADGTLHADPDHVLRYAPLVLLAEQVDVRQLADWYRSALPMLQQAYEELGYPGQRFHARLLAVLDHLLATPPAPQPLRLRLTEVRGPVPSTRPWVRYEYADPALEQASAGRKILWRVGPVHQRRLMKVVAAFREEIRAVPR